MANLDEMNPAQRAEALAQLAREGDVPVRKSVAVALGRMGAAATPALAELLADADEGVRVLACQALGRVADPAAVPALLGRVHDASAEVRAGVLFALANVAAHGGLSEEGRAALFTPMVVMAFDPDDGVRSDAAATLGTLRDARAVEPLTLLAQDACARVRANACASLGLLDAPEACATLLERASDEREEPLVRVSALDGLARQAERGTLAASCAAAAAGLACGLACGVASESPTREIDTPEGATVSAHDLAVTAVWALGMLPLSDGEMRARAQEALEGALASADIWAQRYAIEALARVGDGPAREALRGADERDLPPEVVDVLGHARELMTRAERD